MKIAYIMSDEDHQLAEEEWKHFEKAGFYALPSWDLNSKRLTLKFGENEWFDEQMKPTFDMSQYGCAPTPEEWRRHDVEDVWVTFESHKSIVHVLMEVSKQLLICTKYN
jgi:hypothetical protein